VGEVASLKDRLPAISGESFERLARNGFLQTFSRHSVGKSLFSTCKTQLWDSRDRQVIFMELTQVSL
jgi:hypothetical protein